MSGERSHGDTNRVGEADIKIKTDDSGEVTNVLISDSYDKSTHDYC